jgi:hypothetical protein
VGDRKTKEFEFNDSKHTRTIICSQFIRECNFNFPLSFPNVSSLPQYRRAVKELYTQRGTNEVKEFSVIKLLFAGGRDHRELQELVSSYCFT